MAKNTEENTSIEENPNSPQSRNPNLVDPTKEEHSTAQIIANLVLAPTNVSGPAQWPPVPWFPAQGPWGIGPNQPWASYGISGEGFSSFGAQPTEGGRIPLNPRMGQVGLGPGPESSSSS